MMMECGKSYSLVCGQGATALEKADRHEGSRRGGLEVLVTNRELEIVFNSHLRL